VARDEILGKAFKGLAAGAHAMNVVVTLCGQWGHILPTLPLSLALRERGHRVSYAFVDHPLLNKLVEDHGFENS
jgi:UDP:flavonoid glycosyltransferase YjiC (YdhE family)